MRSSASSTRPSASSDSPQRSDGSDSVRTAARRAPSRARFVVPPTAASAKPRVPDRERILRAHATMRSAIAERLGAALEARERCDDQ
jgi:hypothetical protein